MTTPMIANNPQTLGVIGGVTPIVVQATSDGFTGQNLVRVQLMAEYVRTPPPGWLKITAAGTVPIGANPTVGPRTLAIGTVLDLPKCESDALIAAGAATLV